MGPDVRHTPCAYLTDVTLADEDTNSILTDTANRAIQGNVAMHVTQPGGQLCKQCKWCHQMKNFEPIQVGPSDFANDASGGKICN